MNQAQKNYIEHRINRGVSLEQACGECIGFALPEMAFMETIKAVVNGKSYKVFRGGPNSAPWYNFHAM